MLCLFALSSCTQFVTLLQAPQAKKTKDPPTEVLDKMGDKKNVDEASEDELKAIVQEYYER